jgi:regulator of sigma E protease
MPPFDGGHVLFVLIDAVKRKPVSMKVRTAIWIAGWVAVGLLLLVVTYRDILRVVS